MTTRRPWYPFYVSDYRDDTAHLTLEEHGIYLLLIGEYWLKGGLPTDEKQLARIVGLTIEEWRCKCINVASLFVQGWKHKRIEKELKKLESISHSRLSAATKRWENKAKPKNALAYANGYANDHALAYTLHTSESKDSYLIDSTRLKVLPVSEEKQAKPKLIKKRKEYPPDFEAFWIAYPTDANMPKAKTFIAWQSLADDDRVAAVAAIPAFKAYCAKTKDYRPVYAERYLSQRRFDGHLQTAKKIASRAGVFVKRGTPQWQAWVEHWVQNGKGSEPPSRNGGWYFASEYP